MVKEIQNDKNLPECCRKKSGVKEGILAGIVPHAGCIAIILFALLGVTAFNGFFKKYLFGTYYLYLVFAFSFLIAIISAFFYIRRFPDRRLKTHWKYLSVLFSSIIIVNLIVVYFIFPYAINLTGNASTEGAMLKLSFEIPCEGHAPLVISELESVPGINSVKYISGKNFEVYYNPEIINEEKILEQDICKEFNAKEQSN